MRKKYKVVFALILMISIFSCSNDNIDKDEEIERLKGNIEKLFERNKELENTIAARDKQIKRISEEKKKVSEENQSMKKAFEVILSSDILLKYITQFEGLENSRNFQELALIESYTKGTREDLYFLIEIIMKFREKGDKDQPFYNPINVASIDDNLDLLNELLKKYPYLLEHKSVEFITFGAPTIIPIAVAVKNDAYKIVNELVNRGVDLKQENGLRDDYKGDCPINLITLSQSDKMINYLLKKGVPETLKPFEYINEIYLQKANIDVYEAPDNNSATIGSLKKFELIQINYFLSKTIVKNNYDKRWINIKMQDGTNGWIAIDLKNDVDITYKDGYY